MERWGVAWYRLGLELLPGWLREQAGSAMLDAFRAAQRERAGAGTAALAALWLREGTGLIRTAWAARRPDRWTRRTRPSAARPPHSDHPHHRPTMDHLRSDLRFAFRTFARRPGLLTLAVVTLSLGVGSSTAMFSVIDSVLLRPLDYPEPDAIQAVYPSWPELEGHPTMGALALRGTWSWPELWLVAEQQQVFSAFAGYDGVQATLSPDQGRPERVPVGVAAPSLFPLLGATAHRGRLVVDDDAADGVRTVLLTFETWRDRFGADPDILDRTLRINDDLYAVVGVLEEGFEVPGVRAAFWVPRTGSSTDDGVDNHGGTRAVGRLAPGVSGERARQEVARILETLPAGHGEHGATVAPLQAELTRNVRPVLLIMLAASGLLLLVACGNVAALLLGAGIDRERELAVRGAIGASRGRLSQQLLTESTLLAALGAVGGVGLASLTTRALTLLAPPGVPRLADVGVNGTVLAFAVGVAVTCGIVFGLIPALSLSRTDLADAMGSTRTTGSRRARLQSTVVVTELALATLLLVGGLLMVRTVSALNRVDPGFDVDGLVTLAVALPYGRFDSGDAGADAAALRAYEQQVMDAVASLPGVEGIASVSAPPFFDWRGNNGVRPEGWDESVAPPTAERRFVSAGYLGFMGIPLVEGRDVSPADLDEGAEPVAIVSKGLADLAWPGQSAVGRMLGYWGREARVVGVAGDIRDQELQGATELAFYVPRTQGGGPGAPWVVRTAGDPAAMVPTLRERIWSVDPDLPITRAVTTDELMADQISDQVYRARLMGVFAALAGVFALLGVYGVTSRSVARRTQELGLRVALGADRGAVHGMVTVEAVRLAVFGVVVGLVAAAAVGGVLDRFLWGVTRSDPVTLVAVGVGLPLLAALAAVPPARRATRVDPLVALKAE